MSKKQPENNQPDQSDELKKVLSMTADTIGKDLLGAVLQEIKLMPDVWQKLNQKKQDDIIDRLRQRVEANVKMAVHLINSQGRAVVVGDLESVTIKDNIKATFVVSKGSADRYNLFDAQGKACLLVVADAADNTAGMSKIKGEPDQREADLGHEYHDNDGGGMDAIDVECDALPAPENDADQEQEAA